MQPNKLAENQGKIESTGVGFPSRQSVSKGKSFPDKPKCRDGKYEGTIGGQTKLNSFK